MTFMPHKLNVNQQFSVVLQLFNTEKSSDYNNNNNLLSDAKGFFCRPTAGELPLTPGQVK